MSRGTQKGEREIKGHAGCAPVGASSTKCCYAAKGIRLGVTLTDLLNLVNRKTRFSDAQKTIADEKISLNVSRRLARPACIAGVLISDPNLSPR